MIRQKQYFFLWTGQKPGYVHQCCTDCYQHTLVQQTIVQHYSPTPKGQNRVRPSLLLCMLFFILSFTSFAQQNLTIKFEHIANGKIIQPDSTYFTPSGEPYQLTKLKYYISNIAHNKNAEQFFLINAFAEDSIELNLPEGKYATLYFLLGVDSTHNCSGAQSGALDPLNDMFWTWNSGYVMFKLEGNSDSSTADMHRVQQHIGGYKGLYKTMRNISINFPSPLSIKNNVHHTIIIQMNLDKYWASINTISLTKTPVIVTGGPLAVKASDNFPQLFSIKTVE